MQKKIAYSLMSLAALWVVFLISAVTISNNLERDEFSESLRTGVAYIDQGIRFFESASLSGFSPVDFLSIQFWSIYLTIFLASLGAFGGLFQLYAKIYSVSKEDFSAERRQNVLLLACATVSSVVLGTAAVLSSVRTRYLLQKFYVLEVHLVRFEGLLFNSFAISANHKLLPTFFSYLLGYANRIRRTLVEITRIYEIQEGKDIFQKMGELETTVQKFKARGYTANDEIEDGINGSFKGDKTLHDLLVNLEFMQEQVRRNIRQLEK